jgi:hypothetical protein
MTVHCYDLYIDDLYIDDLYIDDLYIDDLPSLERLTCHFPKVSGSVAVSQSAFPISGTSTSEPHFPLAPENRLHSLPEDRGFVFMAGSA